MERMRRHRQGSRTHQHPGSSIARTKPLLQQRDIESATRCALATTEHQGTHLSIFDFAALQDDATIRGWGCSTDRMASNPRLLSIQDFIQWIDIGSQILRLVGKQRAKPLAKRGEYGIRWWFRNGWLLQCLRQRYTSASYRLPSQRAESTFIFRDVQWRNAVWKRDTGSIQRKPLTRCQNDQAAVGDAADSAQDRIRPLHQGVLRSLWGD